MEKKKAFFQKKKKVRQWFEARAGKADNRLSAKEIMTLTRDMPFVTLRIRVSQSDVHYAGDIASGSLVLGLFGDAATELLIRNDGDEGLFRAYSSVEFLAPIKAGDFLEVTAKLVKSGNTSREIEFEAVKVIESAGNPKKPSQAKALKKPILVAKAHGTCVV